MNHNFLPIESISDTARLIAIARAIETERPDANFHDPWARMLGGDRGEKLLLALSQPPENLGFEVVIRTCLIDEAIAESIKQDNIDTVLNLAAGLDTRPYRMLLSPSLRWIEVDLPAITTYKQEKLQAEKPVCHLQTISLDLTNIPLRNQLFTQINNSSNQVLIITEGLLAYLTHQQVKTLAIDLRKHHNFCGWICELASPLLMAQVKKKWGKSFANANAKLQFAPPEGPKFFTPYGWKTRQYRNLLAEAPRFNRDLPFGWEMRKNPLLKDGVAWLQPEHFKS